MIESFNIYELNGEKTELEFVLETRKHIIINCLWPNELNFPIFRNIADKFCSSIYFNKHIMKTTSNSYYFVIHN